MLDLLSNIKIDSCRVKCLTIGDSLICPKGWRMCKIISFSSNLQMYVLGCDKGHCYIRPITNVYIPIYE